MDEAYRSFFSASAGASAAFIGLLFVALSFVLADNIDPPTRDLRRIIANNAFLQLVNIFFVSMVSLYANVGGLAQVSVVWGALGLISTARMLPKTFKIDRSAKRLPWVVSGIPIVAYLLQVGCGLALLAHLGNTGLIQYLALAVIFLYAGALARAWEITGLRTKDHSH
jgi:hypothetical protein